MTEIRELAQLPVDEQELWDAALIEGRNLIENSGVISRFAFVDVLNQVLVPDAATRIIWRIDTGEKVSFFPCYLERKRGRLFDSTKLRHICDLYPGRSAAAALLGGNSELLALVNRVFDQQSQWDSVSFTVLADGPMEKHILATSGQRQVEPFLDSTLEYPYIELPDDWGDLYGSFTKKFRYNIRNSRKLLDDLGDLKLVRTTGEKDVPRFLQDAYSIERNSWKEDAGTSLTTNKLQEEFHTRLVPIAAANDLLQGYILYLDDTPIAHVIGLLCDGVFYSLKLSYSEAYRKYSPGTVMTALVIQELIAKKVKYWDFAGPTEKYKRRWTSKSYSLKTFTFFSRNLRGQLLKLRRKIRTLISP